MTVHTLPAEVTMSSASAALRGIEAALAGNGELTLDASGLATLDSAAVALLLQAQRLAQARGARVRLLNAPEKLRALAALYGVESLLGST